MSVQEKNVLQRLWQACCVLPPDKQEFLLGYAEGVIASTQPVAAAPPQLLEAAPREPE